MSLLKSTSFFLLILISYTYSNLTVAAEDLGVVLAEDDEYEYDDDEVDLYEDKLPWAVDLASESNQSACEGQPMVLMFGSSTCPYCSVVRSLYMVPLSDEERYQGIVAREVEIDSDSALRGFSGESSTMRKLAEQYGVFLVPTVMVFGPDGKPAGKPIVGISNEDFYGFYLDEAIIKGREMVTSNVSPSGAPAAYACD